MFLSKLASQAFAVWSNRSVPIVNRDSGFPDASQAPLDSRRLIRDRRYCHILSRACDLSFDEISVSCAWQALQHEMALIPGGSVRILHDEIAEIGNGFAVIQEAGEPSAVDSFYIDRYCITNADFARFVNAGGYEKAEFWPQEILPWVLQFTDSTGNPGPAHWKDGRPPEDRLDHPVVGVCWYEANAYARWAGKRLLSSVEWQRAGTWPRKQASEGCEQRYPWGNSFELSRANLWQSGHGQTVPVDAFPEGNTPNGVHQLIGNVWEWIDAAYLPIAESEVQLILEDVMAEIRGAAFDTYFPSQAICQFRSGQPTLHRAANVGFRCCLSTAELIPPAAKSGVISE